MDEKTCNRCCRALPIASFSKDRSRIDGRTYACRECENARHQAYHGGERRPREPRQSRQPGMVRFKKPVLISPTQSTKKWRAANNEKVRAQRKVRRLILRNEMERQPCERCGGPKAQAHHDDYSRPLEVMWLCPRHHRERHRELRQQEAA